MGIFCRLTDFFSYESLWSLPSIATLFDFIFAVILGVLLYCKAENRILFFFTLVIATATTFFLIYQPYVL